MSIAACLLLYSVAMLALAPPVLRRLTRSGHAPRLGVAVWLAAIGSVALTWAVAAGLVVLDVVRHWNSHTVVLASCIARLHGVFVGDAGVLGQIGLLAAAVAVTGAAGALGVRLYRTLARLRERAHEHAHAVRIVGSRGSDHDVVVLDTVEPAAYCVSGRPAAIVLTTAALAALDGDQLAAVLAHERAHLAGRHPEIVAVLRALALVLPRVRLITTGAAEVPRLLEMCADDNAVRRHGHQALLAGLASLAGAVPAGAVPAGALGAADLAVTTRAQRLAAPPGLPARAHAWTALTTSLAVLAAGPPITLALASTGALLCGP